jgi:tRNA threonylcarbamoyladenosine biosynthesis protein TsaE
VCKKGTVTDLCNYKITTHSVNETKKLGEKTGACLQVGMVLALIGDLGTGKTSFVQGLAKGLEVSDEYYITSPSYTMINEYPGRQPLFHVDLYRLEDPVDFEDIGLYDIFGENFVVAIEWADKIRQERLPDHVAITFKTSGDHSREIYMSAYGVNAVALLKKIKSSPCPFKNNHSPGIPGQKTDMDT